MLRARIATAMGADVEGSVRLAADRARSELAERHSSGSSGGSGATGSPVDGALVVVTAASGPGMDAVAEAAVEVLGTDRIAGASVHGFSHHANRCEQIPGAAVIAFQGVEVHAVLLDGIAGSERRAGEEIADHLDGGARVGDWLMVFPDAHHLSMEPFLAGLREELGPATITGVGTCPLAGGESRVWATDEMISGGASALVLRLPEAPWHEIIQGGDLVSESLVVTRCRGNWIDELSGRPALDVYRERAFGALDADLPQAARTLLVATSPGDAVSVELQTARIRNVVGFDVRNGAFAVAEPVRCGSAIALFQLDPVEGARRLGPLVDTARHLAGAGEGAGVYFGCRTRSPFGAGGRLGVGGNGATGATGANGMSVYRPDGEIIEERWPGAPILGISGPFQLATLAKEAAVLTYAGSLTLPLVT